METADQILIKDLNEGDIFVSKKGSEGKYLKSLENGEHLLLSLSDNKQYKIPHGNIPVFKKNKINIKCGNVFEDIKTYEDCFFNTIYSDPPYNLSSKWFIDKEDNKFKIKGKAKDFMNKWDGFDENTLDLFMKESFRILKWGGYLILYGIDRQLPPFQYYALKNGFEIHQSLYWYFINSMPKGVDAGKMIDKRGAPASDLSKQFDSYRYGIAPFKQCVETIMVFHKPCKNGSVLNDLLSSERDLSISPSVININENRVPIDPEGEYSGKDIKSHKKERYPSQVLISDDAAKIIDNQSGILKSGYMDPDKHKRNKTDGKYQSERGIYGAFDNKYLMETYGDKGGCSRILHKCNYESGEYDLFNYCKKATRKERNLGLMEEGTGSNTYNKKCLKCNKWARKQQFSDDYTCHCEEPEWEKPTGNTNLCVKPIELNYRILNLFKLPDKCEQKIYIPFFGSGSEIIGAIKAKYKEENIYGCEIDKEYFNIAKKRIQYWKEKFENENIKSIIK